MTLPKLVRKGWAEANDSAKNIHPDRKAVLDSLTVSELLYVRERYEKFLRIIARELDFPQADLTGTEQKGSIWNLLGLIAKKFGEGTVESILTHFERKKPSEQNKDSSLGDTMYG